MMFTFSNEYLLKSMWASVREEGDRIVSLGLASHNDLKKLIEPSLQEAIKKSMNGVRDNSLMLRTLAILYDDLEAVCLPGDFEKLASGPSDDLENFLDKLEEIGDPGPMSEDPEVAKEDDEQEPEEEEDNAGIEIVFSALEDIAYGLGREGKHEAAYLVERTVRNIEKMALDLNRADSEESSVDQYRVNHEGNYVAAATNRTTNMFKIEMRRLNNLASLLLRKYNSNKPIAKKILGKDIVKSVAKIKRYYLRTLQQEFASNQQNMLLNKSLFARVQNEQPSDKRQAKLDELQERLFLAKSYFDRIEANRKQLPQNLANFQQQASLLI